MIPALARWNGDHAMTKDTTKEAAVTAEALAPDDWFDAIEDGVRARARGFLETMLEEELSEALSRPRYGRRKPGEDEAAPSVVGVRHGHRERTLTGTFGKTRIAVPRARLTGEDGKTREWRSGSLRAYQRRTRAADALIAGAYLLGTNTRRVQQRVERGVCRAGRQGRGQPRLAQGEGRLGRLERALACRRTDRAADPRRHSRACPARQKGDLDLVARGARRARRRPEDAARDQEHGRGRRGGLACAARRSGPARIANAGAGRRRRRAGPRKGAGGAVARHGCPTLHRAQASQSPRPRARAPARGNLERLPRHDLRRDARRGRDPAQGVHPQMAPQMPRRRRQPGGSRRQAVHIHAVPAEPMEIDPNLERDRAIARGVQAPDQDSDRAALRRNRRHAVLGAARLRTDHHAQGRRMADPRRETRRSDH